MLDAGTAQHERAKSARARLLDIAEPPVTTSCVRVETYALAQARFRLAAVRTLQADVFPVADVVWVDQDLHRAARAALLIAQRRNLSLVDCVSFVAMRRAGLRPAFAFNRHFAQQGFQPVA